MRYPLIVFCILCLGGCFVPSKTADLFERDYYNPKQHGPAVERNDTIGGHPVIITEYREESGYVYGRSVKLSDLATADTFYYPNRNYYSWRYRLKCENPTDHLYDSVLNQQYDKRGMPESRMISVHHDVDTAYIQYFDDEGQLLPERHRVIMELL